MFGFPYCGPFPSVLLTVLVSVLLSLLSPLSIASEISELNTDSGGSVTLTPGESVLAGKHWRYIETSQLTPEEVHTQLASLDVVTAWQQSTEDYLNLGMAHDGYWLALSVTSEEDGQWYLRNRYSLLDLAILFQCPHGVTDSSQCSVTRGGDRIPYHERVIDHPNLILPVDVSAGQTYDLYLYVTTEGTYQLPMEFVGQEQLQEQLIHNGVFRGAYYAVMLAMALYNLVLFFAVRDRLYLYYTAFVSSFLFFHMNFEGSAYGYFWPDSPELNSFMVPLTFAISQFFFALFLPQLLYLRNYCPKADMVYRIYVPVTLAFAVMSFAAPYQTAVSWQNYVNSFLAIYTLIAGIRDWTQGHKPAKYFTLAWLAFMVGVVSANLSALGVIPGTPLVLYGYQIGSVFDVILISLAMGARINMLRDARERDQRRLTDSQNESIRLLKQYEDLYQNSLSGRFQLNSQCEVIGCNPAFASILGFRNVDEVLQVKPHLDQLIETPQASIELWDVLERHTQVSGYELTLMPKRGSAVKAILTMRRDKRGDDACWAGSFLNVTEKYEQENALQKLQENRQASMQQLVMGVSHEMNTPLGNIRLAATHIQDRVEHDVTQIDPDFKSAIHQVNDNIARLADLNKLIQSSMGDTSSQQPDSIYLRSWFSTWTEDTLKRYPKLELEVISYPDTALWRGQVTLLERVLNQLTDNAVVHNSEVYNGTQLYVRVSASLEDDSLTIEFQDNGRGISADAKDKIFMPFYTTRRAEATKKGLGLYEVHNLVTHVMGGSLNCPDVNQGFAIQITLPEVEQELRPAGDFPSQASW